MAIYHLIPALKDYIWGGTKLKKYRKTREECKRLIVMEDKIYGDVKKTLRVKIIFRKFFLGGY